jgi:hypothetical protein
MSSLQITTFETHMSSDLLNDRPPVVLAYQLISSPVHIAFWCPRCKRVHLHGAYGGDGFRVSHCHDGKRFFGDREYYLVYAGKIATGSDLPRLTSGEMSQLSSRLDVRDGFEWLP